MNNLIIGDTSQLSYYFPNNYLKISSRNINFDLLKTTTYDTIYLLFAEQRTFLDEDLSFFLETNFDYTIKVIDELKNIANRIVIYSTSELWNNVEGCIQIGNEYNYNFTPYIKSKEVLCNFINENRKDYDKVKIIYPFNFNSVYRRDGFLFGKIYDSIINNKKITVGNIDFYRDITHPKIIVDNSITATTDTIIGSGELISVKKFITDLFEVHNKNVNDYISFTPENILGNKRKNYFSCKQYSTYETLLNLSIKDIYEYKIS